MSRNFEILYSHRRKLKKLSFLHKSVFCYLMWSQFSIALHVEHNYKCFDMNETELMNSSRNLQLREIHRTKRFLHRDLKYILIWTLPSGYYPFMAYKNGHKQFVKNNCSVSNCYITGNRNFFQGDLTKFDVIAFNGRYIYWFDKNDLPEVRTLRQKYVYGNSETGDNFPIKQPFFDDFFNWTFTYRFDSDFVCPYFYIKNKRGEVIGPKNDMKWEEMDNDISWLDNKSDIEIITQNNKKKAAAWFVSNCYTFSGREFFAEELNHALKKYNLNVDTYGKCGDMQCLGQRLSEECNHILKRDYFFYLALENSLARDYVTEKILTALNNDVIPIVYGAANYSKFLPPNSYIEARKMKTTELAAKMYELMNNIPLYLKYFRWKKYYTFERSKDTLCDFCEGINDESRFKAYSSYKNIRKWWNENESET